MKKKFRTIVAISAAAVLAAGALAGCGSSSQESASSDSNAGASDESGTLTLTNVSYDPTRELYEAYNELFKAHYQEETGQDVEIVQSHGGSGSQARSVVEGADADVVTLALAHDITLIEEAGMIKSGWLSEFPLDSSPYTSTQQFEPTLFHRILLQQIRNRKG